MNKGWKEERKESELQLEDTNASNNGGDQRKTPTPVWNDDGNWLQLERTVTIVDGNYIQDNNNAKKINAIQ